MAAALACGALSVPLLASPAQAGTPVTISSGALSVRVDSDFPRVIDYTHRGTGNVLYGNEDALSQVTINGATQTPAVTSTTAADRVDYTLTLSGGAAIHARISVADSTVEFRVTSITDPNAAIRTIAIPGHNLVSVRSTQGGTALATTRMHTATTGTGDTFTSLTASTAADSAPQGQMYAIVNTGQLAASIATNSYYDTPSGATANENARIYKQVVSKSGYRRAGLWSGDWLYRPSGAPATEPLPFAKVVVTPDRNGDAVTDWQDGAIAFRDIMTNPLGWEETKDRVVQRIPFNFASQATHPFLQTLDETKRVSLATDGLGQFVLLKGYGSEGHDSAHPDYGFVGPRQGGAGDLRTLTTAGAQYNADFGVHVNAQESYPVASSFSESLVDVNAKGWNWLDQSYVIRHRDDANSGNRLARLQELKTAAPDLKFLYVDVWYRDGWETRKLAREINGLGYQVATEFPDKFEENTLWNHWATDVNYGGSDYKGINSQITRFIRNHQRDDWIARDPMLGGAEIEAYEGWQGKNNFGSFLNTTFGTDLPTKYLQGFTIQKWAANRIDLSSGVSVTMSGSKRTISKDGHPVLDGKNYLLPWSQAAETKLYHWNDQGGTTTWSLPSSWAGSSTVKLYRLTDQGRVLVSDLAVTGGQVSITATARTAYVVYPTTAPAVADVKWGEGQPLKDPRFYSGNLNNWTVSGSASVVRNSLGQSELSFGSGAGSVSQPLTGLPAGSYSASVNVKTAGGRKATLDVGGTSAYTTSSTFTNNIGGDEKYGSTMQKMQVFFDVPAGGSPTLTLSAAAGTSAVLFDDVRVFAGARTAQGTHHLVEDFENTTGGWGPFAGGPGHDKDPRSHIAQKHAPYTQAGWNGKPIDDVIGGSNSLKTHEESAGLVYRTLPQTVRFTPGRKYSVSLKFEQAYAGDYAFVVGDGSSTVSTTNFAQARTPQSFALTFDASSTGESWIGVSRVSNTSGQDRDLVIDDLVIDDAGPGGGGGSNRLNQALMSVKYCDSQELSGENAPCANVLDGNSSTIWHTQWSGTTAPMPHEIQLDLGGTYSVSNLYYLPRQTQSNGRIANYEVYVSADGTNWGTAVATGTFPNAAAEQTVSFTAKSGRYVRLRALSEVGGNAWTSVAELNVGVAAASRISQSSMSVVSVDSADTATSGGGANVLDGDTATLWHTAWSQVDPDTPPPHEIVLDLGRSYAVSCLYYLPRQTGTNGRIANYEVYVSADGTNWGTAAATGTWTNAATEQSACVTGRTGRYVKLRTLTEVNGGAWTSVAELNVSGT
ncbi:endo-alpha-N-acetylgalactosaminidase family protein [Longispora albida]|uniref:endo-alpha-N-acetylgalactosaminidase family protein n=1 Tax=Longispora albida TaxID=203523 RepID=UPI0003679C29|nr:endo-alpha-N-acetylgalactosaminidase family protein [Longispora albida]